MTAKDLVGYKGESFLDPGYFYAPYVPITQTPVVIDPNSFATSKGILTKYGKKILANGKQFYQTAQIKPKEYRSINEPFESSKQD